MNVCFILVLSILLQLLFGFLVKLLLPQLIGIPWFTFFQMGVMTVFTVFLPAYLYLKDEKKKYFTDCFNDVKPGLLMLLSVGIGFCGQYTGIAVNLPVNILVSYLGGDISSNVPLITNTSLLITATIVMCLFPAVFEEVMFRGVVFNYFRQFGKKAAIIISAFLFAVMHFDFTNFFATFVLGIICALLVSWTNRLIYPMIVHFTLNFVSVMSSYITNFDIINNFYNDYIIVFLAISIPLLIYLMGQFRIRAEYLPYHDQAEYEHISEKIIEINEESSIKIIEHDIRENNMKMALRKLYASPYFYILMILFVYLGGSDLWK